MPMPTPRKDEKRDDFVSRCMSDETAKRELPDNDARLGMCYSQWREKHPSEPPPPKKEKAVKQTISLSQPQAFAAGGLEIDREAGTIRNVSILTRGPAIGHGFDVDDTMLRQVAQRISMRERGVKCRLSHSEGGMFGGGEDPVMTMLGRVKNARIEGDRIRGDVQLAKFASVSPKGNIRDYILGVAEEDPEIIGLSIIFEPGQYEERRDDQNQALPPAGRVREVLAVDFVGDPAANPGGLLSAKERTEAMEDLQVSAGEAQEAFVKRFNGDPGMVEKYPDATARGAKAGELWKAAQLQEGTTEAPVGESAPARGDKLSVPPVPDTADAVLLRDKRRRDGIMALARTEGMDVAWAQGLCDRHVSLAQAKELVELANVMKPVKITVGEDLNVATLGTAVADAISLRSGLFNPRRRADGTEYDVGKPHDRAKEFRSLRLMGIGRKFLSCHGVDADLLSDSEVVRLLFNRNEFQRRVGLTMSTADFPFILANVLNKSLRQSYELAPSTWAKWCSKGTAADFKQISRVLLSSAPALVQIIEGAEYTFGAQTEAREVFNLVKYGKGLSFTWEAMINDDTSAFSRTLPQMGAKARYLEDQVAYATLTANANMADGVPLFNAAHANVGGGALTPAAGVASLTVGYTAMGLQTDLDGVTRLNLGPKSLIVPKALEIGGATLIGAISDPNPAVNANTPNFFAGKLEVVPTPHLDATSAIVWYLAADPAMVDTVEMCFLEGEEQPVLAEDENFQTDAKLYKVRHVVAAKPLDWRGLYASTGV